MYACDCWVHRGVGVIDSRPGQKIRCVRVRVANSAPKNKEIHVVICAGRAHASSVLKSLFCTFMCLPPGLSTWQIARRARRGDLVLKSAT